MATEKTGGNDFDERLQSIIGNPKCPNGHKVSCSTSEDESHEAPNHPAEAEILSLIGEIGEHDRDRIIGNTNDSIRGYDSSISIPGAREDICHAVTNYRSPVEPTRISS